MNNFPIADAQEKVSSLRTIENERVGHRVKLQISIYGGKNTFKEIGRGKKFIKSTKREMNRYDKNCY